MKDGVLALITTAVIVSAVVGTGIACMEKPGDCWVEEIGGKQCVMLVIERRNTFNRRPMLTRSMVGVYDTRAEADSVRAKIVRMYEERPELRKGADA